MLARERISLTQVMMLVVISRLSLTLVYFGAVPAIRQDVWWQSFLAALTGIGFVWVLNYLWQKYPNKTFFQVVELVLGRWLGKLVCLTYILFWMIMLSLNLRLAAEFFLFAFLPRTPIIVVIGVIAGLAAWSCRAGVEVMARVGQVIFPMLIGSILLIVVLLAKDIDPHRLLPLEVLITGPVPHLKDMVSVAARTVEIAWLGIVVPCVSERHGLFKAVAKAQLWQGAVWVIMNIAIFGILGREIEHHFFPFFEAARYVHVADFLERIDAIFLSVWLFGMFLRAAMMLWASAIGTAQLLDLKHYRPVVLPLAGIAVSYAVAQGERFAQFQGYLAPEVLTPFTLTFVVIIPVLILAVAGVRKPGDTAA